MEPSQRRRGNSRWSSVQTWSFWLWLYLQPRSRLAFCWRWDVSLRWNASENISSEISTGEKGGRRGVLLPGQERRGARAVSPADDGSLWVSKRMSQCSQRPRLWPHVEKQNPGFYSNSRVCMKMSGLSVRHKIQNQSPGLQTLLLISFTELSIGFRFVYRRNALLMPKNRQYISGERRWNKFCLLSQTMWTSLEFSWRHSAWSSSSSVWLPAFVIPLNADASATKATVKTSG